MSDIEMRGGAAVPPVIEFPHIITVVPVGPVGSICISHLETFEVVLTTECKVHKAFKVSLGGRVFKASRVRKELRAQMEFVDHKGLADCKGYRDRKAFKVRREFRDCKVQRVQKGRPEFKALRCRFPTRQTIVF
jgi:hypothetical protein